MSEFILTIDLDDWYQAGVISGTTYSLLKDTKTLEKSINLKTVNRIVVETGRILDFLKSKGIKATFFVTAEIAERHSELVQSIVSDGHEIGCHGLDHVSIYDYVTGKLMQNRTEFRQRTVRALEIIEKVAGSRPIGFRAPNFSITGWAIDSLEDMGFKYDSSVYPTQFRYHNDKGVPRFPYIPARGSILENADNRRNFLEFPLVVLVAFGRVRMPWGGGNYTRLPVLGRTFGKAATYASLKKGPSVFYFHPYEISRTPIPLIQGLGLKSRINGTLLRFHGIGDGMFSHVKQMLTIPGVEYLSCRQYLDRFFLSRAN